MDKKTLYTHKDHKGAHIILTMRDVSDTDPTQTRPIADIMLIGSILPFSAELTDLKPFSLDNALTEGDLITILAQEAATLYGNDPARVQRGSDLARGNMIVQNAQFDFMGERIKPSLKNLIVKGSTGWYNVTRGSCTCPDHARGNVCKHRIAAWIHKEMIIRPLANARRVAPAVIMAELTEDAPAENF